METTIVSLEKYNHLVPNQSDAKADWDWTEAFNALMNDPCTLVSIPKATYYLRYPKAITRTKTIMADGATFNMKGMLLIESNGTSITGLTINGYGSKGERLSDSHGIMLSNVSDVDIRRCTFKHIMKNGIQFHNVGVSSNINIEACNFSHIGTDFSPIFTEGSAIYIQRAKNVTISRCKMEYVLGQSAIFVQRTHTVLIEKTTIENVKYRGIQTFGITGSTDREDIIRDMKIHDCTIRHTGRINFSGDGLATNGIFIRNPQGKPEDVKITLCLIEYCGENCLEGSFEAYLNTLKFSGAYDDLKTPSKEGVYLHSRSIFSNNKLVGSKNESIKVFGSRIDIIIQGNIILDPGTVGILVQAFEGDMESISLTDNIIRDTTNKATSGLAFITSKGGKILDTVVSERNTTIGIKDSTAGAK